MFEDCLDFEFGSNQEKPKEAWSMVRYPMKKGEGMRKTYKVIALKILMTVRIARAISAILFILSLTQSGY